MDKVRIEWLDSRIAPSRWDYIEDLEPLLPLKCETIGFLLEDTPQYKVIVQTVSDNLVLGRISIPTVSIVKIEKIKE